MTPYYSDDYVTLYHGRLEDVLPALSGFHACVCDPPYGLSFMGRKWDYDVPSVDAWRAVYDSLLPGAHLTAFAGTRTQHRMAVNIEDAGFEIRDMIAWIYGSGFPKSLDVSKAIDKAAGAERDVVGKKKHSPAPGVAQFGQAQCSEYTYTAPATPEARQWNGWGTALKPALEPCTLARKPLIGTVAQNVLTHGTGAINVDECRVETSEETGRKNNRGPYESVRTWQTSKTGPQDSTGRGLGRFPANLIHDGSPEVVAMFPETASGRSGGTAGWQNEYVGGRYKPIPRTGYDDAGGSASRFFYCAKADSAERGEGNTHPTVKPLKLMQYLIRLVCYADGIVLDPFAGSGSTGLAARLLNRRAVLIEMDEHHCEIAARRLASAMTLFSNQI